MKFDYKHAIIVYSGIITLVVAFLCLKNYVYLDKESKFKTIDVGRINIREPDGTLRMTIASSAQAPGLIVGAKEYPRPDRRMAGMLFFNDEGAENGGLIFAGKKENGTVSSGGSLTFDRYHQDQVLQLLGIEEGQQRTAGLIVNDQPEKYEDFAAADRASHLPPDQQESAYRAANVGGTQRAFVGRATDKSSEVVLRDAAGRKRLVMRVSEEGKASINFLDEAGKIIRTVTPEETDGGREPR